MGSLLQAFRPVVQRITLVSFNHYCCDNHLHMLAYHGINQLHTIVLSWIVARRDHDTNPLSIKLSRSQSGKKTYCKDDGIEQISVEQMRGCLLLVSHLFKPTKEPWKFCQAMNMLTLSYETARFQISSRTMRLHRWVDGDAAYPRGPILKHAPLWKAMFGSGLRDGLVHSGRRHCGANLRDLALVSGQLQVRLC
jgi:hypothetical protein